MKVIRREQFDTQEELVLKQFSENEPIIYKFDVVPLDHEVSDLNSPTMFVSKEKILFSYDDLVEIYDLNLTILAFSGAAPSFSPWRQVSMLGREYSDENKEMIVALRDDQREIKFSLDEEGAVPKDFMLRKNEMIQRPYQTWAFGRLIIDLKNEISSNPLLIEMGKGDFLTFNQKTLLYFIVTTIIFFLLKWLVTPSLPEIIDTVLDILFAVILVLMGVWLYMSYKKNLDRYESVYRSYFEEVGDMN